MRRVTTHAIIAASVLVLAWSSWNRAFGEVDGDRFRSKEWRVRVTAPKNWQISEQTSYPNVLLWMVRRNPPGKMLLSAEKHPGRVDSLDYANATVKVLESLGFRVRPPQHHSATGAYWIDFDSCPASKPRCEGKMFLRQAFLVADGIGYALTLSARNARTRNQHLRAFDFTLRSLRLDRRAAPDASDKGEPESTSSGDEEKR